jgi:hypothetical protein
MVAALLAIAMLLTLASGAGAQDAERAAMAQVRLSTEQAAARGCSHIGTTRDNSVRDLRRKIVRAGGNLAVISFHVDDLSNIYAEIFRCGGGGPAPAGSVPGPPPGGTAPPPAVTAPPPPVVAPAAPAAPAPPPLPPPPPPPPPAPPMR